MIQGISYDNGDGTKTDYYPSLIYLQQGFVMSDSSGTDAIVLTRGWEEPAVSQQSARMAQSAVAPQNGRNHRFYRTKLFSSPQAACKTVVVKPLTERPQSAEAARMAARVQK